jgi:magnesium-transporting ATPase (P-type)
MYYLNSKNEAKWANVKNSKIVEELGQVGFIFSDKTGNF